MDKEKKIIEQTIFNKYFIRILFQVLEIEIFVNFFPNYLESFKKINKKGILTFKNTRRFS